MSLELKFLPFPEMENLSTSSDVPEGCCSAARGCAVRCVGHSSAGTGVPQRLCPLPSRAAGPLARLKPEQGRERRSQRGCGSRRAEAMRAGSYDRGGGELGP